MLGAVNPLHRSNTVKKRPSRRVNSRKGQSWRGASQSTADLGVDTELYTTNPLDHSSPITAIHTSSPSNSSPSNSKSQQAAPESPSHSKAHSGSTSQPGNSDSNQVNSRWNATCIAARNLTHTHTRTHAHTHTHTHKFTHAGDSTIS